MSCELKADESVIGILRAYGNESIGSGHVMRTLALAQFLTGLGKLIFATDSKTPLPLVEQFHENGFGYCLLDTASDEEEASLLREFYPKAMFVVTDGYDFSENYHSLLQDRGFRIARVVDFANKHFIADLIINHSPGVKIDDYAMNSNIPLCLGLDFSLLQSKFIEKAKRPIQKLQNRKSLFINVGGADPENITGDIIQLLEFLEQTYEINIVVGKLNIHEKKLLNFSKKSKHNIFIHSDLTAESIISLLETSSMAICSASTISIEVCACRVPLLVGWSIDNQCLIYNGLVGKGLAIGLGEFNKLDCHKLSEAIDVLSRDNFLQARLMQDMQKKYLSGNSDKNFIMAFNKLLKSA